MRTRHFGVRWLTGFGLVVVAALDPGARAAPPGGNWPQWRGPQRDGVSTETGLLTSWPAGGPKRLFMASGLGRGFSSVSITRRAHFHDGRPSRRPVRHRARRGDRQARLGHAHRRRPQRADGFSGPRGTPTVDGAWLYALGTDGDLVCLETATGKERWRRRPRAATSAAA